MENPTASVPHLDFKDLWGRSDHQESVDAENRLRSHLVQAHGEDHQCVRDLDRLISRRVVFELSRMSVRNALNEAYHGEGALIDDHDLVVANVCAFLKRQRFNDVDVQRWEAFLNAEAALTAPSAPLKTPVIGDTP